MPYTKTIGTSPVYRLGYKTIMFDQKLSNFLKKTGVPHWAPGITFMDSYDAYIEDAKRWTPLNRWKRTAFKMVYTS